MAATSDTDTRELVIRRTFDAPRDLVWRAWADRDHAERWWGPTDFTTTILETDFRPGGAWRAVMRSPRGEEYPQHGEFREIVPPERLVFTMTWSDDPSSEMLITVTLEARGDRTEMLFRKGPFASDSSRRGENEGWNESFDRLRAYVDRGA